MAKPATVVKATSAKTATVTELKPDADGAGAKGKARKGLILGLVAVLLAGGGAGGWFLLRPAPHGTEAKAAVTKAPVFLNLDPFTVNLLEENGDHYLQVGIVYQVENDKTIESAKVYMPVLRNKLLLLLSGKRPSELSSPEGKNKLVAELIAAARESVPGTTPERGIVGAYLSAFVIQ